MGRVQLCKGQGCDRLPVTHGWCWDCAHERQRTHEPLRYVVWDAEELD